MFWTGLEFQNSVRPPRQGEGERLKFKLIALYINWQSIRPVSSDRGFCLSTEGYQKVSLLAAGTSLLSKLLLVSINANGVSLLAECGAKRYSPLPVLSSAAVSSPF